MFKLKYIMSVGLMAFAIPLSSQAQTVSTSIKTDSEAAHQSTFTRENQPIAYWVDENSLNILDNPVAGNRVGKAQFGEKILAYAQYENWIRITKDEDPQEWINSDFLTNSKLTLASFTQRSYDNTVVDFTKIRIKDPKDRKRRVYGVRMKKSETGNILLTTSENSPQGQFYKNYFISCDKDSAVGLRLIGEGYSFLKAQNDARSIGVNIYEAEQVDNKISKSMDRAIASFACSAPSF